MPGPYKLNKFDLLRDVANDSPRAAELLSEYGLHCLNCFFREFDTLEMGAKVHGMTDEELDAMINEINKQLKKEWGEEAQKNPTSKITNHK